MDIRPISSELQKKAEDKRNEVPSRNAEYVQCIRDWIAQQPHLHARTDDQWLLNFLRGCKFDLKQTKEKLDLYYTIRTFLPEYYSNRNPSTPEIERILKLGLILPLPKLDGDLGPRCVLIRANAWDAEILFHHLAKVGLMLVDILMAEDDVSAIGGQHAFIDMRDISLDLLFLLDKDDLQKLHVSFQSAYPIKPRKFDLFNAPSFLESIFSMVKSFLSEKLLGMINLSEEEQSGDVLKSIPSSILPKEYGGEGDSLENLTNYWKTKVESYKEWFKEDAQFCTDESKRPEKPKNSEDVFGAKQSLRNLSID